MEDCVVAPPSGWGYMVSPTGPLVACEDPWALRTESSIRDFGGPGLLGLRSTPSRSKREFSLGVWLYGWTCPFSSGYPYCVQDEFPEATSGSRERLCLLGTNPQSRES